MRCRIVGDAGLQEMHEMQDCRKCTPAPPTLYFFAFPDLKIYFRTITGT